MINKLIKYPPQYTFTAGDHFGVGAQSAEIVSEDCLSLTPKLGCGSQTTFRGCSDVCIGDFCPPDDTCHTGAQVESDLAQDTVTSQRPATPLSITRSTPATTTTTSTISTTTISTSTVSTSKTKVCERAGVRRNYYRLIVIMLINN